MMRHVGSFDALFYPIMPRFSVRWSVDFVECTKCEMESQFGSFGSVKSGRNIEPGNRNLPAALEDDRSGSPPHHTHPDQTFSPSSPPFGVPRVFFPSAFNPQRMKRNNNSLSQTPFFSGVQNLTPFIIFTLNPYLTWSKPITASWCQSSVFITLT
jgi:hypothetical protein